MKKFKTLLNTEKSQNLEKKNIYSIICTPVSIKRDEKLKSQLKSLLGVEKVESIRKVNYYSKGYVKLYVRTSEKPDWL